MVFGVVEKIISVIFDKISVDVVGWNDNDYIYDDLVLNQFMNYI